MILKFGIPLLAACLLGFGVATTVILKPEEQLVSPANPPASTTLGPSKIAGLGEFQGRGEAITISAVRSGVVKAVFVVTGDTVRLGQPLFAIDDREMLAELELRKQELLAAEARLARLRAGTRPEDIAPARARVDTAQVAVDRAEDALRRSEALHAQQAMSDEELRGRVFAHRLALAELAEGRSELARLEAGAWVHDIAVAERERDRALAEVGRIEVEIDRAVVRSPCDAVVLRADIQEGEFVQAGDAARAPIVLARSGALEVKVQVDEEDASRVRAGSRAEGFVRGRERARVGLSFVRIEPRVVPKLSVTGATTERVDTRVLFVVYEVVESPERIYPGQKVDVFIEAQGDDASVAAPSMRRD